MSTYQTINILVKENIKLHGESNKIPTDKVRYQMLIGRLMFLTHTRLDLDHVFLAHTRLDLDHVLSKKLDDVASSNAKTEFIGMSIRLCEAL